MNRIRRDETQGRLTLFPTHDRPFRWLPRQGKPLCLGEWLSQSIVRCAPVITLAIVAVSLFIQVVTVFDWF